MKTFKNIFITIVLIFIILPLVINILLFIFSPGLIFFIAVIGAIYLLITGIIKDFN